MDEDILQEKIKAYRESIGQGKPDLDIALLLRVLDMVNEECEMHVAVQPVNESGEWVPDAPTYAVAGVRRLDDGRIALRVHDEKHGMAAGKLYDQLKGLLGQADGKKMPVLYTRHGEVVQLTDIYSHALVREAYAGLPFNVVLAVSN